MYIVMMILDLSIVFVNGTQWLVFALVLNRLPRRFTFAFATPTRRLALSLKMFTKHFFNALSRNDAVLKDITVSTRLCEHNAVERGNLFVIVLTIMIALVHDNLLRSSVCRLLT